MVSTSPSSMSSSLRLRRAQIVQRILAVQAEVGAFADEIGGGDGVEFVFDFADDFFQNVFQRDHAAGGAEFVDDDGHVNVAGLKLPQHFQHRRKLGDEKNIAADFPKVDLAHPITCTADPGSPSAMAIACPSGVFSSAKRSLPGTSFR